MNGGENMKPCFHIVVLAHQILKIVVSQIETKTIFFFSKDIYKPEKMLFIIKKIREIDNLWTKIGQMI